MIVDALIKLVILIVDAFNAILPPWHLEIPGLQAFVAHISRWNAWVPVTELGLMIGIVVSLSGVMIVWKLGKQVVDWIMDVIP